MLGVRRRIHFTIDILVDTKDTEDDGNQAAKPIVPGAQLIQQNGHNLFPTLRNTTIPDNHIDTVVQMKQMKRIIHKVFQDHIQNKTANDQVDKIELKNKMEKEKIFHDKSIHIL